MSTMLDLLESSPDAVEFVNDNVQGLNEFIANRSSWFHRHNATMSVMLLFDYLDLYKRMGHNLDYAHAEQFPMLIFLKQLEGSAFDYRDRSPKKIGWHEDSIDKMRVMNNVVSDSTNRIGASMLTLLENTGNSNLVSTYVQQLFVVAWNVEAENLPGAGATIDISPMDIILKRFLPDGFKYNFQSSYNTYVTPDCRFYFSLRYGLGNFLEDVEALCHDGESLKKIAALWNIDDDLEIDLRK